MKYTSVVYIFTVVKRIGTLKLVHKLYVYLLTICFSDFSFAKKKKIKGNKKKEKHVRSKKNT